MTLPLPLLGSRPGRGGPAGAAPPASLWDDAPTEAAAAARLVVTLEACGEPSTLRCPLSWRSCHESGLGGMGSASKSPPSFPVLSETADAAGAMVRSLLPCCCRRRRSSTQPPSAAATAAAAQPMTMPAIAPPASPPPPSLLLLLLGAEVPAAPIAACLK